MPDHLPPPAPPDTGGAGPGPAEDGTGRRALAPARLRVPHGALVRPEAVALGDFRIRSRIGAGAQGAVYLAHQISLGRPVALKVLDGGAARRPTLVARFAREAALLGRLDHPNVVRCYGAGAERGFHYFAMEYVDGWDAAALLRRAGRLAPADALRVAARCAEALGHAAARRVVHRDVKPGNVLVGRQGEVKLTDWGAARPTDGDHALTGEHMLMGTLRYVAPEQFRDPRRADHRSDMYALGGVLYELLTGRVPFPGEDWVSVLRAKETGAFAPAGALNPAVPRRCEAALARMLAPDPADRHPDYDGLIADLGAAAPASGRPDPALFDRWAVPLADGPAVGSGPRLNVLLVYDEAEYLPLVEYALHAAEVPHDLRAVEDGRDAVASVARGRGARPDVLILGLTSPTQASLRVLTEARCDRPPGALPVSGLSTSPDGADLLRGLDLGSSSWVAGFGDLGPLSQALRAAYAGVAAAP